MAVPPVVRGAWTHKRQQEMDWVSYDRCLHCGKEGSEYHRLYECEAHKIIWQRDISNPSAAISNQHKKNDFGKRPRGENKAMNG